MVSDMGDDLYSPLVREAVILRAQREAAADHARMYVIENGPDDYDVVAVARYKQLQMIEPIVAVVMPDGEVRVS